MPSADPLRGRAARAVGIVLAALVLVAFVRGTRSEVRYETDPEGRAPVDERDAAALADARAGTACGGWSPLLSTTERPVVAPLHAAVWADTKAFHVRSDHVFVLGIRFDVEGGTAASDGLDPAASLTVPTQSGRTIDVTIDCRATAVTIRLVGGDGKDVADAVLGVGAQPGETGPLRLAKGSAGPTPAACEELADAQAAFVAAGASAARIDATSHLIDVASASLESVADQLSAAERHDADVLIELLGDRLAELEAGSPDALRPVSGEEAAALGGVATAFERLCG